MRCVSFCTTENYRLTAAAAFFRNAGYTIQQYRKVLHISKPSQERDIFIFSYGCLVTWGLKHKEEQTLLQQLQPFAIHPMSTIETSIFIYRYENRVEMAPHKRFNIDVITLNSDNAQLKLAISYGFAQSIQLEFYESSVQKTIDKNANFPQQLAKNGKIKLSQKEIVRRMGHIFLARSSINLKSDYLAAPEYFWEYPSFEDYYNMSEKFLDISRRVSTLNQKLDVLHELFDMLNGQLQHRRSNILEMIIILLIFVEIVIVMAEKMLA